MGESRLDSVLDFDQKIRELRSLELRAYGALLTAFRAAGDLDEEKRDTLGIVRQSLKISEARHKVEVRRVATHPRLCLIADAVNGFNTIQDWRDEGFVELPSEKPVSRLPSRAYRVTRKLKLKEEQDAESAALRFDTLKKLKDEESFSLRPRKTIRAIKDFTPITTLNGWASNDDDENNSDNETTTTEKKPNIFSPPDYQSLTPKIRKKLGSNTSSDSESSTEISIESLKRKGLLKYTRPPSKNPLKTLKKQQAQQQQQQIMRQKSPHKLMPRVQQRSSPDIIDAPVSPPKKMSYSENSHLIQVPRPRGPKRKISLGSPSGRSNIKVSRNNSKSSTFSSSGVAKRFKKMHGHYLDDDLLPPSSNSPNHKHKVKIRRKRTNLHPSELPRDIEDGLYPPFIEGRGGEEEEIGRPYHPGFISNRPNLTGRGITRRGGRGTRGGPRGGMSRFDRGTTSGRGRGGGRGRGRGKLGTRGGGSSRANKLKQPQKTIKPKMQQSKRKQLDEVRVEFLDEGESDKDDHKDMDSEQERMIRNKSIKYGIDLDLDAQEEEEEKKKRERELKRTSSPDIVTNDRRVDRKGGPTEKYNNNNDKFENFEHGLPGKTYVDDDDDNDHGSSRRRNFKESPTRKLHKNSSDEDEEYRKDRSGGLTENLDKSDAENSNSSSQSSATSQQQKQHFNIFPSQHRRENSPQPSMGDKKMLLTPPKANIPPRNPLPAPVFSTSLDIINFNKKRAKILNSTFSPIADFDSAVASSTTASSLARRTPTLFSASSASASTAAAASGTKPPAILPQRKAQPHILVNSKAQRNLANTLSAATNSNSVAPGSLVTGTPGTGTTTTNTVGNVQLVTNQGLGVTGMSGLGVGPVQQSNPGNYNIPTISSIQNFPTSTLSMSNAIPIGPVRTSQGANIIFLQKTGGTSGSGTPTVVTSGGLASSEGSTTIMTGGSMSMQNVSGKPRAVILRRANVARQGNVMIVDMHKNANQVPQFLQTARILNSESAALLANLQNQGGTVGKIVSGAQTISTPSLSSAASSSIMSPSIIVSSSNSTRSVVNTVSIANQGAYPVRVPINQMNLQHIQEHHQHHKGKRVSRIFSPGEVKTLIRVSNLPKSVLSMQQKVNVVPSSSSSVSGGGTSAFIPCSSTEEEITDSSTVVTPVADNILRNERLEPEEIIIPMSGDGPYYEETVISSTSTIVSPAKNSPTVVQPVVDNTSVVRLEPGEVIPLSDGPFYEETVMTSASTGLSLASNPSTVVPPVAEIVGGNERFEPGEIIPMGSDGSYYEETVMTTNTVMSSAKSNIISTIPDSLTFPSPVKLSISTTPNSEEASSSSLLPTSDSNPVADSEIIESSLNLFKSCMNDTNYSLDIASTVSTTPTPQNHGGPVTSSNSTLDIFQAALKSSGIDFNDFGEREEDNFEVTDGRPGVRF